MALKQVRCNGYLSSSTLDPTMPSSIPVLVLPLCIATPSLPLYATGKNLPFHSPVQFLSTASTLALPLCMSAHVLQLHSLDPTLPLHPSNTVLLVPTVGSLLPPIVMLESRLDFCPPKKGQKSMRSGLHLLTICVVIFVCSLFIHGIIIWQLLILIHQTRSILGSQLTFTIVT